MSNLNITKIFEDISKDGAVIGSKGKVRLYLQSATDKKQNEINMTALADGTWKASIAYGASKPLIINGKESSLDDAKNKVMIICTEISESFKKNYLQYSLRNNQNPSDYAISFCYSTGGIIEI